MNHFLSTSKFSYVIQIAGHPVYMKISNFPANVIEGEYERNHIIKTVFLLA